MGLKDIWNKTSFARKAAEDKAKKEEEEILRAKVRQDIAPEIERIKMDKIKEEELAKARGTFIEPEKKKNPLLMLSEEFKQSNIGSNDQMDKILGRQAQGRVNRTGNMDMPKGAMLSDTNRLLDTVTTNKRVDTNRDFGGMLGSKRVNTNRDLPGMLDGGKSFSGGDMEMKRKFMAEKVGGVASNKETNDEKLKRILGGRK